MAEHRISAEPIAIVGIGCRFPGGVTGPRSFWELLRDGREAITEIPQDRWDLSRHFDPDPQAPLRQHVRRAGFIEGIDQFDPSFFGISPREAVCMDPQQRLLMEVSWHCLEDAGQPPEAIRGKPVAVIMGISSSDYTSLIWASEADLAIPDNEPFMLPGNTGCIAANRLSYFFDFKGPSFTVDTACSSSLVAVHLACEAIWNGEASAALAGGVQALIQPCVHTMFCKAGLLAPDGRCKSFDAAANGYVRSEGAGAVLLKPLSQAEADGDAVYAVIRGTAVNSDGRSNGMVAPNYRAQVACVKSAFRRAGVDPASAQYVEAHGTGTRHGDPIEMRALGMVLGQGRPEDRPCRVGSVKTNLGHSETAAGITGLIKAALCVHHRQIPASLHFNTPNPSIDFQGLKLRVQTALEPFPDPDAPPVVGVSSFGFGGTNAHVVLDAAPEPPAASGDGQPLPLQLLALSARSEPALRVLAGAMADQLAAQPELAFEDLCATANQCRGAMVKRLTCLAPDRGTLIQQLKAFSRAQDVDGVRHGQASRQPGRIAFLFTGQGSQAPGMAQGLYEAHPVFREAFDRCTALLDPLLGQPLSALIFPADECREQAAELLSQTRFTQPALFVVGYALSQLWLSWGVRPDLLMGHSVGEVVAAHLAGVFSLEDALRLIEARGRLMQALPAGGGMLALLTNEERVQQWLASLGDDAAELHLAAINGPSNVVVAGALAPLERLEAVAVAAGVRAQRLAVSHAFHSPALRPMLPAFEQVLRQIRFSSPRLPVVSNVTGQLVGDAIATVDYWCQHVISPVRFGDGMAASSGIATFIEMGARPTLIGMGRHCLKEPYLSWLPSLRPGQEDFSVLLDSLARLYELGHSIDWRAFHSPFPQRRVKLAGYPFQRQRYWLSPVGQGETPGSLWRNLIHPEDPATAPMALPRRETTQELDGAHQPAARSGAGAGALEVLALPGGSEQRLQSWLTAAAPADLSDHRIRNQVVFPAAGFLLLALQALEHQDQPLALADLELETPLRLSETPTRLHLVLGDRIEFHSASCEAGDATPVWRCHGHAIRVTDEVPDVDHPPFALGDAPATAVPLDLEHFYASLKQFGLNYGPAFRGLIQLHRAEDEVRDPTDWREGVPAGRAWGTVQRPEGARDWALLDACFQAVAATLDPEMSAGQLLLPVGVQEVCLAHLPLPDRFEVQVQQRGCDEAAFVVADLVLRSSRDDGQGEEVLGWLRGFRLRRLPRQALEWLFPQAGDETAGLPGAINTDLVRHHWIPASVEDRDEGVDARQGPPVEADVLWLEADQVHLEQPLQALLELGQKASAGTATTIWLVLEGDSPVAHALASMARSAALEAGRSTWFTLWLPAGSRRDRLNIPWNAIERLAREEATVAFDGQRLLVGRILPVHPERFRYATSSFGMLESLLPAPLPPQVPARGELELAVEATGLNFRDVLNALGLLRDYSRQLGMDEAARVPFGGECVGRVGAVGAGVDPALIGQRLLAALAVGSLASHVVARAELCVPLPPGMSIELGASLSTAFLTAEYGLDTLAQLKPGESVLIHAAAGGVGQAAVQVAQRLGARVFATASEGKHALLRQQGVEAVFDSRSTDFADALLTLTDGRGVDVVLNSLKGAWVDASFRVLAQGGRFVELGKIEIWSRAEVVQRRPDARYLPFDLLEVAAADPGLIQQLLRTILNRVDSGEYRPIPLQSFPIERTVEAFRLMAQSRHIGKVVLRLQPRTSTGLGIRRSGTYLVSGAFGGIGRHLCQWMADQGAQSLLLLTRPGSSGPDKPRQEQLASLEAQGLSVQVLELELGSGGEAGEQVVRALRTALDGLPDDQPLLGVFHAAGVLDDGLLPSQTPERIAAVMAPKLAGWQQLERALQACEADPELVVMFSSMSSLIGSPGQAGYSAANGALDGLMQAAQRPGWLSLQWGPWASGGMATALDPQQQKRLQAFGLRLLEPAEALERLARAIRQELSGAVAAIDVDWRSMARQAPMRQARALEELVRTAAPEQEQSETAEATLLATLRQIPAAERLSTLVGFIQAQLAKVMGIADSAEIDPGEPLFNMGLDSLMALELMVLLEKNLGVKLTESLVFEYPTTQALARYFFDNLFPDQTSQSQSMSAGTPSAPGVQPATVDPEAGRPETTQPDPDSMIEQELEAITAMDASELLRQLRG
jgi:acyl transferase domain-containing protein